MTRSGEPAPPPLSLSGSMLNDSGFIHKALADHFPNRDVADLSTSELSFLLIQAQRLKVVPTSI